MQWLHFHLHVGGVGFGFGGWFRVVGLFWGGGVLVWGLLWRRWFEVWFELCLGVCLLSCCGCVSLSMPHRRHACFRMLECSSMQWLHSHLRVGGSGADVGFGLRFGLGVGSGWLVCCLWGGGDGVGFALGVWFEVWFEFCLGLWLPSSCGCALLALPHLRHACFCMLECLSMQWLHFHPCPSCRGRVPQGGCSASRDLG